MAKVLEYGFADAAISLIADSSGNGADLNSNVPSTALAFAGTAPHKRVDCSVSNSSAHLARYLADSSDPVRTALEGAQKLRLIWRGRWGTVPDFRNVIALNNYTALYGSSLIGFGFENNKLFFSFNGGHYDYMQITRPSDGATVDHTYEARLDTTLDDSPGNERLKFFIDDVLVNADSTGIALNETLSLPSGMQIAVFGQESDNFGWRAFSANVGTAYIGLWVGETEGAYSEPNKHAELVADDDTFGSAPDTTAPITSALVTVPTSATELDASFATNEPGTGYFLVSSSASESQSTIAAAANSAAAAGGACSIAGLTWSAGQYLHAVQKDDAATPNWSNVLSVLITDAQAPVATGPLAYTNVVPTGGRITWAGATDNIAVTVWRRRLDGGAWTEFGGAGTTYFDLPAQTEGASVLVEVQAGDGSGNWSNTLSKTITVGSTTVNIYGIVTPKNSEANSDVRFKWGGSNLPPRYGIAFGGWRKLEVDTGYVAEFFYMSTTDTGGGTQPGNMYFVGAHPYPSATGAYDGAGDANPLGSSSDSVHFEEMAGQPTRDKLKSVLNHAIPASKSVWVNWWFEAEVVGANVVQRYYPNIQDAPTDYIEIVTPKADIDAVTLAADAALGFGNPFWSFSGSVGNEAPGGIRRGWRIFTDAGMSTTDKQAEGNAAWLGTDAPATAAGAASVWYINDNWKPDDILDKSGLGHHPDWWAGVSTRPTLFSDVITVATPAARRRILLIN